MELSSIQHIDPEILPDFQPDLFIAALSHETRSTSIANRLEGISCRKLAIYNRHLVKEFSYATNLDYFQQNGFEIMEVDDTFNALDDIFQAGPSAGLKIILDCTSMSQLLYYSVFNWLAEDNYLSRAHLRLVYTMAGYREEGSPPKVRKVKEFLKVKSNSRKRKRVLILGLGQESHVADMICRLVKPDLLYLFYADPPADKQFVEKVFVNNHGVINVTPIRNLVSYPINNGQVIYQTLIDVILPLRDEYTVMIIPQGPKVFSMASMLLQMGYPDTVLSYPVFKRTPVQDRLPCSEPVVLDVLFEAED